MHGPLPADDGIPVYSLLRTFESNGQLASQGKYRAVSATAQDVKTTNARRRLSPSTLGDWCSRSLDLLEPIHQRIGKVCQGCSHLSTDATPLPVLDYDDPRGIKRGHLWPVRSDCEVLFLYALTATGTLVSEFLADFKGTLQTDGISTLTEQRIRPVARTPTGMGWNL